MIELGKLEEAWPEFAKQNVQLVVVSLEDQKTAQKTQKQFPHLVVVSDPQRKLCDAVEVIHPHSAPDGGDTAAPTTFLIDGTGTVRWTYRADRVLRRLTPDELLAAIAAEMPAE